MRHVNEHRTILFTLTVPTSMRGKSVERVRSFLDAQREELLTMLAESVVDQLENPIEFQGVAARRHGPEGRNP